MEAGSVYVKKLNTYFYASPVDEERGVTQVDVADKVRVSGIIDKGFFQEDEVQANFIRELGQVAAE